LQKEDEEEDGEDEALATSGGAGAPSKYHFAMYAPQPCPVSASSNPPMLRCARARSRSTRLPACARTHSLHAAPLLRSVHAGVRLLRPWLSLSSSFFEIVGACLTASLRAQASGQWEGACVRPGDSTSHCGCTQRPGAANRAGLCSRCRRR
jgi:hypothetical protein